MSYLAVLLGLVILIFILLGMELFGGWYQRPELNYTHNEFPELFEREHIRWCARGPSGMPARHSTPYLLRHDLGVYHHLRPS